MTKRNIEILSEYYQNELSYLRSAGEDFAAHYPKIARRLDLNEHESSDPHIERLLESFAFLTGKLQKQIDDQFPEIATTLLNMLYKPLLLPLPSCVMVNFDIDMTRATQAAGSVLPKGMDLHTTSASGEVCHFRTAHDVYFWPLNLNTVNVVSREKLPSYYGRSLYYIKIDFESGLKDERPSKLRFYIMGNALLKSKIYAALFSTDEYVIYKRGDTFSFISTAHPIGCDASDSLFYESKTAFPGFRLLQEYFAFPDKFYGFDIELLQNIDLTEGFSLFIPIGNKISTPLSVSNFSLYSVPAINLFPKISEPLRLDYRQVSYPLVADYRQYKNHEIYTIERMVSVEQNDNSEVNVPEFFECNYAMQEDGIFWTSQRKKSNSPKIPGDDVFISFVDTNFNPSKPANQVFYAYCLCTNRYCAEQIPAKGVLQIETAIPVKNIYCAERPTAQKSTVESGKILWKLISLLSLNSLSFTSDGTEKLKTLLNIFVELSTSRLGNEVESISNFVTSFATKRFDEQAWKGFTRGMNIEITFDDKVHNLGLPLSLVISKFLTSYITINTFVDVTVKNTEWNRIVKKWNQQMGIKEYL